MYLGIPYGGFFKGDCVRIFFAQSATRIYVGGKIRPALEVEAQLQTELKLPSIIVRSDTHPVVGIASKPPHIIIGSSNASSASSSPPRRKETRTLPPRKESSAAVEYHSDGFGQQWRRESHERNLDYDSVEYFIPSEAEKKWKFKSAYTSKRKAIKIPSDDQSPSDGILSDKKKGKIPAKSDAPITLKDSEMISSESSAKILETPELRKVDKLVKEHHIPGYDARWLMERFGEW